MLDGWQTVELPAGMTPSTVQPRAGVLLIGGNSAGNGDRAPALVTLPTQDAPAAGTAMTVPLRPATPYGTVADLVSLTGADDAVVALGVARGGAHANARWTIWSGRTGTGVIDQPQTFETFGGWEAGTLLGVATDRSGPMVIGTWQGVHGQDGTTWRVSGDRWLRQPAAPALTNTALRQVAPQHVDQQPDGSVTISGSVIDLSDGVHQQAARWRDVDGRWSATVLTDPGGRSTAWSTVCTDTCWSAGARDGALALWSAQGREDLPPIPVTDADRATVLRSADRTVVLASSAGQGRLLIGDGTRWRTYAGPDGVVQAATLVGTRLYLLTGSTERRTLLVRDLADVLAR